MARAVHYDASKAGQLLRWGLCGFSGETDTDITKVSCKACRKRFAKGAEPPTKARTRAQQTGASEDELLRAILAPKAPAPPKLDPGAAASCCEALTSCGARHTHGPRPCGHCPLCEWEREANLWGSKEVAAHNREHRVAKIAGAPRWSSINKALVAYAEYHAHQRHARSASAGIIARLQRGADTDGGMSRPDDPMQRAADDIVAVEAALHAAYPEGAHALPQSRRIELLLVRTPGVAPIKVENGEQVATPMPSYEDLSALLGHTKGDLEALVNTGRARAALDLFERGMIPRPQEMRRDARQGRRRMVGAEPEPTGDAA